MASEFALSFTLDGMALARRTRTGEWRTLGTVAADSPVRGLEMRALAQRVRRHTGGDARVALLVPETEILCLDLPAVPGGRDAEAGAVRAALDGRTPYALDELCFDWVATQGRVQVAAVACELLDELRGLARGAGFDVREISAVLPPGSFAGEPGFVLPEAVGGEGPAPESAAETAAEPAAKVVPEPAAVTAPEPATKVAPEVAAETAPEPVATPAPEAAEDVAPESVDAVATAVGQPVATASAPGTGPALPEPPAASQDAATVALEPGAQGRGAGRRRGEAGSGSGSAEVRSAEVPAPVSFASKRDSAARLGRRPGPVPVGRAPSVPGASAPLGSLPAAAGPDAGRPRFSTAASAGGGAAVAALRAEAAPGVVHVGKASPAIPAPEPRLPLTASPAPLDAPTARPGAGAGQAPPFRRSGLLEDFDEARETRRMRRVAGAGMLVVLLAGGALWWFGGGPGPGEDQQPDQTAAVAPDAAGPMQTGAISPPAGLRIGSPAVVPEPAPTATPDGEPEADVTTSAPSVVMADAPPLAPLADVPRAELPELSADSLSLETLALPLEPKRPLVVAGARLPDYVSGPGDTIPSVPGVQASPADSAAGPASPATATQPTVSTVAEAVAAAVAEAAASTPPPGAEEGAAGVDLRAGPPTIVQPDRPTPEPTILLSPSAPLVQAPTADRPRPRARPGAAASEVAKPVTATADAEASPPDQPAAAPAPRPRARPAALDPAPVPAAQPPQEETRTAPPASPAPRSRPARITLASAPASAPVAAPVASILRPATPSAEAPLSPTPTPAAPETSAPAAAAAVAPAGPVLPTRASVARAATEEGQIALRKISLVGVYGAPGDRRALVRLGNGRYVKIEVGDELDGGRVAAIGERDITYVKRGEAQRLAMPGDG